MKRFLVTILCGALSLFFWDLSKPSKCEAAREKINDVYVIHFIIDGANASFLQELIDAGKLPTIKRIFVDEGTRFTNAVAPFPATSTSSYQSFVTGLFPGNAGIPHLERFDRIHEQSIGYLTWRGAKKINSDLVNLRSLEFDPKKGFVEPTTLFELLKGYPTLAIHSSFHQGASDHYPKGIPFRAFWSAFASKKFHHLDALAMRKLARCFRDPLPDIPRYTLVGLLSTDLAGHAFGSRHLEVEQILMQFDSSLETFLTLLSHRGIQDRTYLILSTDHGMHDTGERFELRTLLRDKGLHPLSIGDRGVASSQIYWKSAKEGERLIEVLSTLSAGELLIARKGYHDIVTRSSDGASASIACTMIAATEWCRYRTTQQRDPLHYCDHPMTKRFCDGKPYSSYELRDAAAHPLYPDAIIQIAQFFRSPRSGDLLLVLKPPYGFRKEKAATHGSLQREDMEIPILLHGPSIPKDHITNGARSTDVYPLVLSWFGIERDARLHDGMNPFAVMKAPPSLDRELAQKEFDLMDGIRAQPLASPLFAHAQKEAVTRLRRRDALVARQRELLHTKGKRADDHLSLVSWRLAKAQEELGRVRSLLERR